MSMFNLRRWFLFSLPFALAVLSYAGGMSAPFFFDDLPNIVLNSSLHVNELSFDALRSSAAEGAAGVSGRPVALLSFALNYFFWGLDPFAYRLTNLLIHLANGALVFGVARHILRDNPLVGFGQLVLPAFVAAAWLLHPIQFLVIEHVVQRMTALAAFFVLAGFWLHLDARSGSGIKGRVEALLAWGVCFPLAFLSKETGILLPIFVAAWELTIRPAQCGRLDRFGCWFGGCIGMLVVCGALYASSTKGNWLFAGYQLRDFSLGERVLTECRILLFYLGQIALPRLYAFGLYHDDFTLSRTLFELSTLLSTVCLLWLLCISVWLRKRLPIVSFGVCWFFIGHSLESTVLPLELVHEHRNYLPLFGILLAMAWGVGQAWRIGGGAARITVVLVLLALSYWASLTAMRAYQYGDEVRRTQMEVLNHPASARAQQEAGRVLAALPEAIDPQSKVYRLAHLHFEKAGELDASFKLGWLSRMQLNCKAGLPIESAWVEVLAEKLASTKFAPGDRSVIYALKELAITYPDCFSQAVVEVLFQAALANPGVSPFVGAILHSWYADYYWLARHDLSAASRELDVSLRLNPSNSSNQLKRAQLFFVAGDRINAQSILARLSLAALSVKEKATVRELSAALSDQ